MLSRVTRYFGWSVAAVALLWGAGLRAQGSGTPNVDLPRFEGYMTVDGGRLFVLTAWRAGSVSGRGMLKIGESFGGFKLETFVRETEVLTLSDALGKKYELRPPKPTVTDAGSGDAEKRRAAKAKAMEQIEDYRKSAMRRFGSASVTVDLDGSLLPESRKRTYETRRKEAEEKGTWFFPVCVDGKWLNVFVSFKDNFLETRALTDVAPEDADEVKLAWKIARAEVTGRAIAASPIQRVGAAPEAKKQK